MSDTLASAPVRRGRPRAAGVRRSQLVKVRVTPDEAAALEARARTAGLNLSDFIRQAASGAPIRSARRAALDPITIHHLALLGSNVNQIARVLNATGDIERAGRMDELTTDIRSLLDMVRNHVR